jgi:hypothetical protein
MGAFVKMGWLFNVIDLFKKDKSNILRNFTISQQSCQIIFTANVEESQYSVVKEQKGLNPGFFRKSPSFDPEGFTGCPRRCDLGFAHTEPWPKIACS